LRFRYKRGRVKGKNIYNKLSEEVIGRRGGRGEKRVGRSGETKEQK